jgi:hypothetical protein
MTNATLRILDLASIKERRIRETDSFLKHSKMSLHLKINSLKNLGFKIANLGVGRELKRSKNNVLAPIVMK